MNCLHCRLLVDLYYYTILSGKLLRVPLTRKSKRHVRYFETNQENVMLRLHYVPDGHGSHDFGHRGQNGVTVTQRRGTGSTNVARRGCRDRRDRF